MERDGHLKSIWQDTTHENDLTGTQGVALSDVIIVGAGITGCTTALELARAGVKCVLVEAQEAGFGTTGGTTAHFNTILDHTYPEISSTFGNDASRILAHGLRSALDLVADNVKRGAMDCGHSWKNGFFFSQNGEESDRLEEIFQATLKAGVDVTWTDHLPIKRKFEKVMMVRQQAELHPLRYIYGLLSEYIKLGGIYMNGCRVISVDDQEPLVVQTSMGELRAIKLIYATHIPPGMNLLHLRCAPYRSYVVAEEVNDEVDTKGLVYDMEDPYHYYRTQVIEGKKWLIIGGEDHKTGHEEDTQQRIDALRSHAQEHFGVAGTGYQWSSQYFETTDGLPYVGTLPGHSDNVMVATGFSGNGMTLGTLSAIAFRDKITTGSCPYWELFDPKRSSPVSGFLKFAKENLDVAAHMISKPFLAEKINDLDEIRSEEGRLIEYMGEKRGIYRDSQGRIHEVDPVCPHAKCTVKWNKAERSWDCPCHGSRFSVDGVLLTGPSTHDLPRP